MKASKPWLEHGCTNKVAILFSEINSNIHETPRMLHDDQSGKAQDSSSALWDLPRFVLARAINSQALSI